jgi:PEP-CTERM motif
MTRQQTLHHFELACGVLPEDGADTPSIAAETPAPFHGHALNDGVDLMPADFGQMIPEDDLPLAPSNNSPSQSSSAGGGPAIYTPPFTGGLTPSGPPTPPPAVPEPSSYILMLTGMVSAVGVVRRRITA